MIEKDGKEDGSGDKYESHTQIGDLTIIFADTRVVLVKIAKASAVGDSEAKTAFSLLPFVFLF